MNVIDWLLDGDPSNRWQVMRDLTDESADLVASERSLDPQGAEARRAVARVRDKVTWHWWDNNPFFVGEVEPCINGRVVAIGSYFGQDVQKVVDRLLGEQMTDGGSSR